MKTDADVSVASPAEAPGLARKAERLGFDGFWANETKHDPFLQLALAAAATSRIEVGTSIAMAFTRSPTHLAYSGWDLQNLSAGRFILGLGSQVKGHVERRFGAKWESPVPRMREVVQAVRAVWKAWQTGERLDFRGRFYRLDLMTPFFNPGPIAEPGIPIFIAGVNRGMCRLAGEVADGLHVHPLHTAKYLRQEVVPALEAGLAKAGRKRSAVQVTASIFAAVGRNRDEVMAVREGYRGQIAFYASTRSYRRVMETHGWGEVCDRLHELSVAGDWERMPGEISDEILDEFVVAGTWEEAGTRIRERYDGILDRVKLYIPFDGRDDWGKLVRGLR